MRYITNVDDPSVGYTQASLNYMMALLSAGYDDFSIISLMGMANWRLLPEWCQPLAKRRPQSPEHSWLGVVHCTPDVCVQFLTHRADKRILALTVTEIEPIPRWAVRKLNALHGIILPTHWNKQVFEDSGIKVPIEVVPHAVGSWWWSGVPEEQPFPAGKEDYVFGYMGTWNSRKNPEGVLRAYLRAFPTVGHTRLAMKLTASKGLVGYLAGIAEEECGSTARLEEGGDIWVYDDRWSDGQIRWFMEQVDCFVSLHRGEGWGYGLHQAAALGRPVIYTGWSAPVEFLSPVEDVALPYTMMPVPADAIPTLADPSNRRKWAEPNVDAAVEAMRAAAASPRRRSAQDTARIRTNYDWPTVGKTFADVLNRHMGELRSAP